MITPVGMRPGVSNGERAPNADVGGPAARVGSAGTAARSYAPAAGAAGPWVEAGYVAHYVVVPARDAEQLEAWFALGFAGTNDVQSGFLALPRNHFDKNFQYLN